MVLGHALHVRLHRKTNMAGKNLIKGYRTNSCIVALMNKPLAQGVLAWETLRSGVMMPHKNELPNEYGNSILYNNIIRNSYIARHSETSSKRFTCTCIIIPGAPVQSSNCSTPQRSIKPKTPTKTKPNIYLRIQGL